VQSAAYITGEALYESRRDLQVNYQNRAHDIAGTETLAPEGSPAEFHDVRIWDRFESFEDTYAYKRYLSDETREKYLTSAQTAMTIVVALPKELSMEVCRELVKEFAETRFVSRGLVVTYALHDDEGNPHAHMQISRRAVGEGGEISWTKDRDICTRSSLLQTRKLWADLANHYLEREGCEARITSKSFADLGIDLAPTHHRGWMSDKLAAKGIDSRIVAENEEVFEANRNTLRAHPEVILNEITSKAATFTQMDLLKVLQKRLGDDPASIAAVFEGAIAHAVVVGEGLDGQVRYTSDVYRDQEDKALGLLDQMACQPYTHYVNEQSVDAVLSKHNTFSEEQRAAVQGLIRNDQVSVLIGRAGAGKTTTLKAVAEIYQRSGHMVMGTSLSALAAENLGHETGISASTLHSLLYQWDQYYQAEDKFLSFNAVMEEGVFKQLAWYQDLKHFESSRLTKNHVVIVDEAGMIGTRQWGELLSYVKRAGAKLIVVGDDHQFKAIEAGDFFRALTEKASEQGQLYALTTIYRQKEEWMKEASQKFASLQTHEALSQYEQRGHIHQTEAAMMAADIATAYLERHQRGEQGLVLAFTNAQTAELNSAIRHQLRAQGYIGHKDVLTLNGKGFALKDKVVFLQNDKRLIRIEDGRGERIQHAFIKNGTTGILESVQSKGEGNDEITIRLVDQSRAIFQTKDYNRLDHGYALTTHKSQGQTVDFTLIAASKTMDAKGVYVAMTRHRYDVQMFYTREDFKTFKALTSHLSRFEAKDLVKDYTILPQNEAAWQRVQEYKLCVLDASAILKDQQKGTVDWDAYNDVKRHQIALGKEILNNFDNHRLYVNQAGLTEDMLTITTGLKQRPLSLVEEKSKLTVQLYGEVSQATRELWKTVRGRDTSSMPKQYQEFQDMRAERDSLAREILENYPLHREFVNQFTKEYGISRKTLQNQVAYRDRERHKTMEISQETVQKTSPNVPHLGPKNSVDNVSYGKSWDHKDVKQARTTTDIVSALNRQIKEIAWDVMGKPARQTSQEWRYGRSGSVSLFVAGTKQGLYSNFETGVSGNVITFIGEQLGLDRKEAFKWGVSWLGEDQEKTLSCSAPKITSHHVKESPSSLSAPQPWIPTYPVTVPFPDLKQEPQLRVLMKGRCEVARFEYKDAAGKTLGYVVRLEDKDCQKITPTLTYCQHDKGDHQWRWQGFGKDRPLYGLQELHSNPQAPVLVVEGEKTCNAARLLFQGYAVITWSGGCGAVHQSDWSVLKGRNVTIFPDNDKAGRTASEKIADILIKQGHILVQIVDLPSTLPPKWDLADSLPQEVATTKVQDLLQNTRQVQKNSDVRSVVRDTTAIDQIVRENRLHLSFGTLGDHHYKDIQLVYDAFKQVHQDTHTVPTDDWILKRATFMVCYLKDQIHHTNLTPEETTCLALIASQQFADRKDPSTVSDNTMAHFKAMGIMRDVDKNSEYHQRSSSQRSSLHREIYGEGNAKAINDQNVSTSPAEVSLKNLIHRINNDYRAQHQLQEQQERDLRLLRQREKSL